MGNLGKLLSTKTTTQSPKHTSIQSLAFSAENRPCIEMGDRGVGVSGTHSGWTVSRFQKVFLSSYSALMPLVPWALLFSHPASSGVFVDYMVTEINSPIR